MYPLLIGGGRCGGAGAGGAGAAQPNEWIPAPSINHHHSSLPTHMHVHQKLSIRMGHYPVMAA